MLVYHYLPSRYAFDDLERGRIKVARFDDCNDPFELAACELSDKTNRVIFRNYKREMAERFGLICFSRSWRNPVLWSHYADRHRGACLGIEVRDTAVSLVNYTDERLDITGGRPLEKRDLTEELAMKLLTTKFSGWRYEDELRSFIQLDPSEVENGLYFKSFDTDFTLKQVFLGHLNDGAAEFQSVLARPRLSGVALTQARLAFRKFEVVEDQRGL